MQRSNPQFSHGLSMNQKMIMLLDNIEHELKRANEQRERQLELLEALAYCEVSADE